MRRPSRTRNSPFAGKAPSFPKKPESTNSSFALAMAQHSGSTRNKVTTSAIKPLTGGSHPATKSEKRQGRSFSSEDAPTRSGLSFSPTRKRSHLSNSSGSHPTACCTLFPALIFHPPGLRSHSSSTYRFLLMTAVWATNAGRLSPRRGMMPSPAAPFNLPITSPLTSTNS